MHQKDCGLTESETKWMVSRVAIVEERLFDSEQEARDFSKTKPGFKIDAPEKCSCAPAQGGRLLDTAGGKALTRYTDIQSRWNASCRARDAESQEHCRLFFQRCLWISGAFLFAVGMVCR